MLSESDTCHYDHMHFPKCPPRHWSLLTSEAMNDATVETREVKTLLQDTQGSDGKATSI